MKVAYLFATNTTHKILSEMIVPQLENGHHVAEVAGMFFFVDNVFLLVKGNDVGERLSKLSKQNDMLLMVCDQCAFERGVQDNLVEGAQIGCFPDLYRNLQGVDLDQVITL